MDSARLGRGVGKGLGAAVCVNLGWAEMNELADNNGHDNGATRQRGAAGKLLPVYCPSRELEPGQAAGRKVRHCPAGSKSMDPNDRRRQLG